MKSMLRSKKSNKITLLVILTPYLSVRINDLLLQLLWGLSPVLFASLSFLAYVWQGNKLTIPTAFTVSISTLSISVPLTSYVGDRSVPVGPVRTI
jgi:hypothetical protein